ncbi:citrate/2-methylcitrate synthase [Aquabacterium sp. J223]|uniref:citrate/2-methylcitrate synthase n=1 Tax=Aquabacterium sp. J223 TaxID=2898431 RepID=UPI0021ADE440|nr:citrate/2-methylcitrate synthase [Aquabacterium sp. J223]UUX95454.1 citrate synthase [Aquabacterium sp. J223]
MPERPAPTPDVGASAAPPALAAADAADCVGARQAMQLLGVRAQTLYAYVSRGWIRSIRQPGRKDRLYLREDIERMRSRSRARAGHAAVAASALNHGEPVVTTSVTEITPQGPRYRGRLALDLARQRAPFESVAELLWTGLWRDEHRPWPTAAPAAALRRLLAALSAPTLGHNLLETFALVSLHLGLARGTVADRVHGGQTLPAARQVITTLVGCCGLASPQGRVVTPPRGSGVAEGLLHAFGVPARDENLEAIEAMLVLLADHELSPGTLSVRVAASTGSTLHSCIAAGLCSSAGLQVARVFDRVHDFLQSAQTAPALLRRAQALQARGQSVPGFMHPLYPRGDPRAHLLFELIGRRPASRELDAVRRFAEALQQDSGLRPRHELPMVALTRAMGLPAQAPGALFAIARIAGWVAHVQEQRLSPQVLRARAMFVGLAG